MNWRLTSKEKKKGFLTLIGEGTKRREGRAGPMVRTMISIVFAGGLALLVLELPPPVVFPLKLISSTISAMGQTKIPSFRDRIALESSSTSSSDLRAVTGSFRLLSSESAIPWKWKLMEKNVFILYLTMYFILKNYTKSHIYL